LLLAFEQAMQRLETCLSGPSVQANGSLEPLRNEAGAFQASLRLPPRRDLRDLLDEGIDLAYRIERAVERRCETPLAPFDRALLLIGRRYGFEEQ
jgi:hypothetical protein